MQQFANTNSKVGKTYISNRVDLSASQPIPFEGNSSAFSYLNDTRYIPFLAGGKNYDQYAKMLLEARLTSTTHNACITTKKDYCAGDGFRHKEGKELDPRFVEWLGSLNLKNESATEINKQSFEAFFTFGNCPIELVRFTVGGVRYFYIYTHNLLKWRLLTPENDIVTGAITSPLFVRQNDYIITEEQLKEAKQLPLYNPKNSDKNNWKKFPDGSERTMIWYKNSVSGFEHYGLPSSVSSIIYQILEYKGARYNLDNFENNMVVAALLILQGNLSQQEANRIAKNLIDVHVGDGNRGRVMAVASEEGVDKTQLHQLETTKDGSYVEADGLWTQKIIQANQWDAILAGIVSPSTLGKGSGFLTKIKEHINNTVITPAQNDSYGKVWRHVFREAKAWMGFNIDENEIEISNTIDISGLTDIDITPAVTRNEARVAKGLPKDPTPRGDEYLGSTPTTGPAPTEQKGGTNVQP